MNNHWPILAAALMISIAVALGLWRRDSTIEALANRDANITQEPVRRELPTNLPAEAPEAKPPKTPTPLPVANTATATGTTAAPAAVPAPAPAAATATSTGTATGASKFALPSGAPPPVAPAAPAAAPAVAPAAAPAAVPAQPKAPAVPVAPVAPVAQGQRDQVLIDLRRLLEGKLTTKATDVANGGFMLKVPGAQLEVQPTPNWSVNIYNMNTQQPEVESDNFKVIYNDVAATLGIDVNQKPATLATGKTSLQSGSKLGNVSVVRDPANGNSVVITPNQQRKTLAPPPQAQAQPAVQPDTQKVVPAQQLQPPAQPKAQPPAQPAPAPAVKAPAPQPAPQPVAPATPPKP